jgi:hypothetical protein
MVLRRCLALAPLPLLAACGSGASTSPVTPGGPADGSIDAPVVTQGSSDSSSPGDATSDDGSSSSPPSDAGRVFADAAPTFLGDAGLPRTMSITNQCTQTVWLAALPASTLPDGGPVEMAPGTAYAVGLANGWSGRFWGRAGCTTSAGGKLTCQTDGFPSSLAELTLTKTPDAGLDFYDVSLVDGFNLPIEIIAVGHTPDPAHPYSCGDPTCAMNLDTTCPAPLQDKNGQGDVVACANDECKVLGGNDAQSPDCIYPNDYTRFFKTACPTAYSYPYDDPTSTFTCKGLDYAIVFCP